MWKKFIKDEDLLKFDQVFEHLRVKHPSGEDAWGLKLKSIRANLEKVYPIYSNYFKTRVFGAENVGEENYIVVSNHSGQIAFDGAIITTAFLVDVFPPRILRAMVERFFPSIPFVGSWSAGNGSVLGDRQNCINLLTRDESVLVFPEGVKGIAKNTSEYYQLKPFTRGFIRIAVETNTPILPICVIGAEEMYPLVYHLKPLARLLKLPALPVTPGYLFGLLGTVPLPSPIDIHIGKPIHLNTILNEHSLDKEIDVERIKIENTISELIKAGLKNRRPFWGRDLIKKLGLNKNV